MTQMATIKDCHIDEDGSLTIISNPHELFDKDMDLSFRGIQLTHGVDYEICNGGKILRINKHIAKELLKENK